ncbi:hypothetical protein ACEPAH_4015 [Sanghuangporus vaninii]
MSRIFLSVSVTVLNGMISTPPNPPPQNRERVEIDKQESAFITAASSLVRISQFILILATLCESLIVIAVRYPSTISSIVLSTLLPNEVSAQEVGVNPLALIAWAIAVMGCLLRYSSINALGQLFTYQLAIRNGHVLVTTGPYAVVRHPAYTGSITAALGTGIFFLGPGSYAYAGKILRSKAGAPCTFVWLGWKLFMCYNVVRRTAHEDEFLRNKFGQSWVSWSQRVRYRLVPGLY